MTPRTHNRIEGGLRRVWSVERLWALSAELPVVRYRVADFGGLDEDCWYGSVDVPTIRSVLAHIERIEAADLSRPIILSASGEVMDGIHRICKALLKGHATIPAVQFDVDPPPDSIEAADPRVRIGHARP